MNDVQSLFLGRASSRLGWQRKAGASTCAEAQVKKASHVDPPSHTRNRSQPALLGVGARS
jgi:hypothetical protein